MQFDTLGYAVLLFVSFIVYWTVLRERMRWQNAFLVAVSYYFYSCWDWRFLSLILFTTLMSYTSGILIDRYRNSAKWWAALNITVNIVVLVTFKYFDFFAQSLSEILGAVGVNADWATLNLVLPIGISFYTFQAISYTADVYREKIKPTGDVVAFMAYICFFPQLVAGPIERATQLLPQFLRQRHFDYSNAVTGMRQILWGLLKKVVIADNCAMVVNSVYDNTANYGASTVAVAIVLFAFQIYADFSGYSDIAIGTARLFGFTLTANFRYPYFSNSMAEFWRRWHMSLMTWFRDYIYIPLGGSRCSHSRKIFNVLAVFLLSGLWHGASWNFVMWGLYNGLLVAFLPKAKGNGSRIGNAVQIMSTFMLSAIGFMIFRCHTVGQMCDVTERLFSGNIISIPSGLGTLAMVAVFVVIEWSGRHREFPIMRMPHNTVVRWGLYWILLAIISFGSPIDAQQFIYFQF